MQDGKAHSFLPVIGLIGLGYDLSVAQCLENATKTRHETAPLPLPTSSPPNGSAWVSGRVSLGRRARLKLNHQRRQTVFCRPVLRLRRARWSCKLCLTAVVKATNQLDRRMATGFPLKSARARGEGGGLIVCLVVLGDA